MFNLLAFLKMALIKYKLVNLPEKGKLKFESSIGTIVLDPEEMTDEDAERLIKTKDENILQYIKEA